MASTAATMVCPLKVSVPCRIKSAKHTVIKARHVSFIMNCVERVAEEAMTIEEIGSKVNAAGINRRCC